MGALVHRRRSTVQFGGGRSPAATSSASPVASRVAYSSGVTRQRPGCRPDAELLVVTGETSTATERINSQRRLVASWVVST